MERQLITPPDDWKRDLTEIFFGRFGIILAVTILVTGAAVALAFFMPPIYSASGSILLRNKWEKNSLQSMEVTAQRNLTITKEDMASEEQILTSMGLIEQVVQKMHKMENPTAKPLQGEELRREVGEIKKNLRSDIVTSSRVIHVSMISRNRQWAENVLETLLTTYIEYRAKLLNPGDEVAFFTERAQSYQDRLRALDTERLADSENMAPELIRNQIDNNIVLKKTLMKDLNDARSSIAQRKEEMLPLKQALEGDKQQYFAFLENETIMTLGMRLSELVIERGDVLRHYREETPWVQTLNNQIANLYESLRNEARLIFEERLYEVEALQARVDELKMAIKELDAENERLQKMHVVSEQVEREKTVLEESYQVFSKRREEASINSTTLQQNLSSDVSILNHADMSSKPITPGFTALILFGILVGLIAGASMGFIVEYLDHSFRRPNDVAKYLNLPVIASIRKA